MDKQETSHNSDFPYPQSDPGQQFNARVVSAIIFGILILCWLCSYINDNGIYWQVVIGGTVSYLILMTMFVQAHISKRQWHAMQDALQRTDTLVEQNKNIIEAAQRQARAVEDGAAAARKSVELTDRPWVSVNITLNGPLTFNDQGASVRFMIIAKNVGRSVAVNVTINAEVVIPRMGGDIWAAVIAEQMRVCQNIRSEFMSYAVFPEEVYPCDITFGISPEQLEQGRYDESNVISLYVVGCVDYQVSGHEAHHQTRFVYEIHRTVDKSDRLFAVILGEDVPLERLILQKMFVRSGDYAD